MEKTKDSRVMLLETKLTQAMIRVGEFERKNTILSLNNAVLLKALKDNIKYAAINEDSKQFEKNINILMELSNGKN